MEENKTYRMGKDGAIGSENGVEENSLFKLIEDLYPICRSITGNGLRRSLNIIKKEIPIEIYELPTGTAVFDWSIPREWNIRDAWVKNEKGEKVIDFQASNLHVLNYSVPVDKELTLRELKTHLYSIPEQPELIPYRTSYYKEQWGFCLAHKQLQNLPEGKYHAFIDSTLDAGSMSHGELYIEGKTKDEVLISTHTCHPSLCNDNLSGVSVAVHLAKYLLNKHLRYSYRFLFIPGTIGSIAWLAQNEEKISRIKYGLVLSCLGDEGHVTYKRSRQGAAAIDRIADHVLNRVRSEKGELRAFSPYGYDERQFCSPGFNLPVGALMRTPFGEFSEYHTSADNLDFIKGEALADSLSVLKEIVFIIENDRVYINKNPKCEPNLGKRGLYKMTGGSTGNDIDQMAILWVLNLSDGDHSLFDIAEQVGMDFRRIKGAVDALLKVQLLKQVDGP